MTEKILAMLAFSGPLEECNPDAAEIALLKAGFTVERLPAKLHGQLVHPLDDFILASIGVGIVTDVNKVLEAVETEINAIIHPFGGLCDDVFIPPDGYVPATRWSEWFDPPRPPALGPVDI
jgi:hypothetical protein